MPPENSQHHVAIKRMCHAVMALALIFFTVLHVSNLTEFSPIPEKHIHIYTIILEWIFFLFSGLDIILHSQAHLIRIKIHTNTFLVLGSISAMAWSTYAQFTGKETYFPYAFAPILFFYTERFIRTRREKRERESADSLTPRYDEYAYLLTPNGFTKKTHVSDLAYGNACPIKPNTTIPTDGIVIFGETEVNESSVTNNPFFVEKGKGDAVFGGTTNGRGSIIISVTRKSSLSTIHALRARCTSIQENEPTANALPEKITRVLLLIALSETIGITFLHLLVSDQLSVSIQLFCVALFATFPWTSSLASPITAFIMSTVAKKKHIHITNDRCFHRGGNIDTVLFGKTGILTKGHASITDIIENYRSSTKSPDLLFVAELLAEHAYHPLSSAIIDYAKHQQKEPVANGDRLTKYTIVPEKGIHAPFQGSRIAMGNKSLMESLGVLIPQDIDEEAQALSRQGCLSVYISKDNAFLGILAGQDSIRPEAEKIMNELREQGIEIHIATGDMTERTLSLSTLFHISPHAIHAGTSPEEKRNIVLALQKEGKRVAFVGNLESDALALATADLRIVVGKGSDLTIHLADIIMIQKPLTQIPNMIRLFSASQKLLKKNIILSHIFPILSVPLVLFSLVPNVFLTFVIIAPVILMLIFTKKEEIRQRNMN